MKKNPLRTNATKRKQVETAVSMERHAGKSDREIAKPCKVSHTLVASIRNPEAKERQAKNLAKHVASKVSDEPQSGVNSTPHVESDSTQSMTQAYGPDAEELKAMELAEQADLDTMYKMLESDDALATAVKEIERLNFLNAQMKIRIDSLMNERNACVTQVKRLEHQIVMKSGKGS